MIEKNLVKKKNYKNKSLKEEYKINKQKMPDNKNWIINFHYICFNFQKFI